MALSRDLVKMKKQECGFCFQARRTSKYQHQIQIYVWDGICLGARIQSQRHLKGRIHYKTSTQSEQGSIQKSRVIITKTEAMELQVETASSKEWKRRELKCRNKNSSWHFSSLSILINGVGRNGRPGQQIASDQKLF